MTQVVVTTPKKFGGEVKKLFEGDIPKWQSRIHRKIHLQTVSGMIKGTPVGNIELWEIWWEQWQHSGIPPSMEGYVGGRARSNWQSSVWVPKAGEPNSPNAKSYDGVGATLARNRQDVTNVGPYARTFLTNNTPYIVPLNDGLNGKQHTFQAPLMWMEGVIDTVAAQFRSGSL